jgi:hypothetical protein
MKHLINQLKFDSIVNNINKWNYNRTCNTAAMKAERLLAQAKMYKEWARENEIEARKELMISTGVFEKSDIIKSIQTIWIEG